MSFDKPLSSFYKNNVPLPQPSDFPVIILPKPTGAGHCKYVNISHHPSNDPQPVPIINNFSEGHLWSIQEKAQLLFLRKDQAADSCSELFSEFLHYLLRFLKCEQTQALSGKGRSPEPFIILSAILNISSITGQHTK